MAYFDCIVGGSVDGSTLTVTCYSGFAGLTISITNGTDTFSDVCPSTSPYEVVFEGLANGTWTLSAVYGGDTYTKTVEINSVAELYPIPNGATATPINNIQTWLHCADIWDKNYTTIGQVLADASTLQALIASNNAVDYMARSTSWASSVTANANAMTYIGANNYCANKLLANSTWCTSICNSTYFESVLNAKVPTMTSNTTPSGQAVASSEYSGYPAWKAFDGNDTSYWNNNGTTAIGTTIGYYFTTSVLVKKVVFKIYYETIDLGTFKLQGSNDGTNWYDVATQSTAPTTNDFTFLTGTNSTLYSKWRIYVTSKSGRNRQNVALYTLQFYGRKNV